MDPVTTTGVPDAGAAPAADTGAAPSENDSNFDAAFAASADRADRAAAAGEDVPAEDIPDAEPEPQAETQEPPAADAVAADPAADPQPADDGDIQPDRVSADGKTLFFSKPKAERLLAARQELDRIGQIIPGATPELLEQHYRTTVASQEMEADFDSADPQRMGRYIDFWFGQQAPQQSVDVFARQFAERLPHIAPEAAKWVEKQTTARLTQSLYDEAIRTGNDELLGVAQRLDMRQRNAFLTREDFQQRDPYAEERRRFETEREQFNRERQAEAQRRAQQREQQIDASVGTAKTSAIEAALKPVEAQFKDKPQWKHLVRDMTEIAEQAIVANPTWKRQFDIARANAIKDPSGKAAEALTAMMQTFLKPYLARQSKSVIEAATGVVLTQAAAAHESAQRMAARTEPTPAGAPSSRTTHQQQLLSAKSFDEAWDISARRADRVTAARQR